ncbi:MAG: hypothetical protein KDC38_03815, partial [Planctomycetes bacterium]|nr:hypothetical protein [Planctomycetota bacterium]
ARAIGTRRSRNTASAAMAQHQGTLAAAGLISGFALFSLGLGLVYTIDSEFETLGLEPWVESHLEDHFGAPLLAADSWDDLNADPEFQEFLIAPENTPLFYESDAGQAFLVANGTEDFVEARARLVESEAWISRHDARLEDRTGIGQLFLGVLVLFLVLNYASRYRRRSAGVESTGETAATPEP